MSYCEVYAVNKNGDTLFYDEAKNAWGGGMHIWTTLADKYGIKNVGLLQGFAPLWKMYDGNVMEASDKLVLGSTFDKVICKKDRLPDLIQAFEEFQSKYPTSTIEKEIEIFKNALTDEDVIGIAWNQTSVNCFGDMLSGGYDEKNDESIPYNIFKQNDHWFLGEVEDVE